MKSRNPLNGQPQTLTEYFAFRGGLNINSPALLVNAGQLFDCMNYEPDPQGGYRRIGGYERFDGRTSPSSATYLALACSMTSTPAVGASVTDGTATGMFVQTLPGGIVLTGVVGTFGTGKTLKVGAATVGSTGASTLYPTPPTALQDATYTVAAASVYRALIQAVPGSGPVRGVWLYNNTVYAFRDNAGGTAGGMWVATASGWLSVALGEEIAFTNASAAVLEGLVLTQGGASATIARVVLESGALGAANTGRLILAGRTGTFASGSATVAGGGTITLAGASTAITLSPGGTYRFQNYNFAGGASTRRMYGVNGVDRAFEFDGGTFVPINSGTARAQDTPAYLRCHRNFLYLAIGASLVNGSVGLPYRFITAEGAAITGIGDAITGLCTMTGESLGIMTRSSSWVLQGASSSTWALSALRADVGAVPGTLMSMSDTYFFSDRGFTNLTATQKYGSFDDSSLSRQIQPLVDQARTKVLGAYTVRQRGHYVLLGTDGSAICMGVNNTQVTGFTRFQLGFLPTCVCSEQDNAGTERIFMGDSTGFVFEMGKGSTFDGAAISSFIKVFFNHSKSPRVRKRYRRAVLEMTSALYSSMSFVPDFSYGDPDIPSASMRTVEVAGAGSEWDIGNWDSFYWSSQDLAQPNIAIEGTGTNVALTFYSTTPYDFGHVLQGAIVYYTPRRIQR
jgi:hypothetical protein